MSTALSCDLLSLSGHKFYGPKGVGALYIRRGVRIVPLLHGGGQEKKRRAGTHNVPGIVGLGKAAELARKNLEAESERLTALRDYIIGQIENNMDDIRLNGHRTRRLPNNVNISIEGIEGRIHHAVAFISDRGERPPGVRIDRIRLRIGNPGALTYPAGAGSSRRARSWLGSHQPFKARHP